MEPNTPRRRSEDRSELECEGPARKVGDDTCDKVLAEICLANRRGSPITIWDLPQITGMPLHAAFAAVRTLEFGRFVIIDDNPTDPFGATLRVREEGTRRVEMQRVA
ncbi:hypothetical protein K3181_14555 [Qipengyuania sp. YG27]|uniref:Uncharacterized protein n=1 Tax=Qipengyuania mesophila TaxID=2867246 RepID=A0ABS7JYG4_9SPHN|nr:hypothetical protein [Qipengyuania mesophila]MBX7502659.1 hypothetical protein [Qipengyuania mesophila]